MAKQTILGTNGGNKQIKNIALGTQSGIKQKCKLWLGTPNGNKECIQYQLYNQRTYATLSLSNTTYPRRPVGFLTNGNVVFVDSGTIITCYNSNLTSRVWQIILDNTGVDSISIDKITDDIYVTDSNDSANQSFIRKINKTGQTQWVISPGSPVYSYDKIHIRNDLGFIYATQYRSLLKIRISDGVVIWNKIQDHMEWTSGYNGISTNHLGDVIFSNINLINSNSYQTVSLHDRNTGNWIKYLIVADLSPYPLDIKTDKDGNIYTFGYNYSTNVTTIKKYNDTGTLISNLTNVFNNTNMQHSDLVVDMDNNIYICGRNILGTLDSQTVKVDKNLQVIWRKVINSYVNTAIDINGINLIVGSTGNPANAIQLIEQY